MSGCPTFVSFRSALIRVHLRLIFLERKERFELSKQVWKTRMFPATSLPRGAQVRDLRLGCGVSESI
jgi:hypothetical protein